MNRPGRREKVFFLIRISVNDRVISQNMNDQVYLKWTESVPVKPDSGSVMRSRSGANKVVGQQVQGRSQTGLNGQLRSITVKLTDGLTGRNNS